jgi:hypothetical protein
MYQVQQLTAQQIRPQQYQYGTVSGYYPMQTTGTDFTSMFSAMMPMIMMILMMAILMPMMKGMAGSASKS